MCSADVLPGGAIPGRPSREHWALIGRPQKGTHVGWEPDTGDPVARQSPIGDPRRDRMSSKANYISTARGESRGGQQGGGKASGRSQWEAQRLCAQPTSRRATAGRRPLPLPLPSHTRPLPSAPASLTSPSPPTLVHTACAGGLFAICWTLSFERPRLLRLPHFHLHRIPVPVARSRPSPALPPAPSARLHVPRKPRLRLRRGRPLRAPRQGRPTQHGTLTRPPTRHRRRRLQGTNSRSHPAPGTGCWGGQGVELSGGCSGDRFDRVAAEWV